MKNDNIKTAFHLNLANILKVATRLINHLLPCLILPVLLPLLIIPITILIILKQVVNIILKIKHGNNFGGIFESADSVWAMEDKSRSIINILLVLKFQDKTENVTEQIRTSVLKNIFEKPDFPKLTGIRQKYMGFNYLIKDQLTVDECVSNFQIDDYNELTKRNLQEIISKKSNEPLPRQHKALWEILISPKPLQWNSKKERNYCYPILIRFSHIAGDGLSLTNFILKTFVNETTKGSSANNISFEKMYKKYASKYSQSQKSNLFSNILSALKTIIYTVYIILLAPSIIIHQHFIRKDDDNSLHGPPLSGEKNLVYAVENEEKLIALVKDAKKLIPDSKFSDILLAAISASLDGHFRKNFQPVPNFVSAVIPALLSPPNMDEKPVLQNQFSVGILDIPVKITSGTMLQRVRKVMEGTSNIRNLLQYQVNFWVVKYLCGFIPQPILEESLKTDQITMTISSVPGLPKVTVLDDCHIEDIVFFTHHRGKTGLGFSSLTYDNRFQLSLSVDKSILASRDEAQLIIKDVFRNIELLHAEVHGKIVSTKL